MKGAHAVDFWRKALRGNIQHHIHDSAELNKYLFCVVTELPELTYILECLLVREFPKLVPKLQKIMILQ